MERTMMAKYEVNMVFCLASMTIFGVLLYKAWYMKPRQNFLVLLSGLQVTASCCAILHDIIWLV